MSSREGEWRAVARAVIAMVALASVAGCSFVTMTPVPQAYRVDVAPRCARWSRAVYADYGGAVIAGFHALVVASDEAEDRHEQAVRLQAALMSGVVAGVYLASGLWGRQRRRECAAAIEVHDAWLRTLPASDDVPAGAAASPAAASPGGAP